MSFLIPGIILALFIVAAILFFGIRAGRPQSAARRNPEDGNAADGASTAAAGVPMGSAT